MIKLFRWCLVLVCVLTLVLPLLADDDGDDDGGGATLDPGLQWKIASNTWDRREYDDAAVLFVAFGDKNPDDDNTLESWWRAYTVYHSYRPNPRRSKETYVKAIDACERWSTKYAESKPDRAAHGYWYKALLLDSEGNRPQAVDTLIMEAKKFPTINWGGEPFWHIGEWLREAKRNAEAINYYESYAKIVGTSNEWGAAALFRIGWCNEDLGNKEEAVAAYQRVLHADFNWGWGQVHWNSLDAARRLKKLGEEQLAHEFLAKIVEKCDQNWDVTKQAMAELGSKGGLKILIYPYLTYHYNSSNVSIDSRSKVSMKEEINTLVRATYITKDTPFKATVTLTPKVEMAQTPDGMKPADGDAKSFQAKISTEAPGDYWYKFWRAEQNVPLPDGVVITRKWEKMGATWGECQIRIQSTARWFIFIYLPDSKTNPNNLNIQPNEVRDAGKTFLWYNWYDLSQGVTYKFPVEVGGNTAEYYPKILLSEGHGPNYSEQNGNASEATYDFRECKLSVKSDTPFPYTISFPPDTEVTLDEVVK